MLTLSPQSRAVAAFALGFAILAGYIDRLGVSLATLVNTLHHNTSLKEDTLLIHVVTALAAVLVFALGRRTVDGIEDRWVLGIGQAAQLLALVGLAIALVDIAAALKNGGMYGLPGVIN